MLAPAGSLFPSDGGLVFALLLPAVLCVCRLLLLLLPAAALCGVCSV